MPNVVHNILKHVELQNKNVKWDEIIFNVGVIEESILKLLHSFFHNLGYKYIFLYFAYFGNRLSIFSNHTGCCPTYIIFSISPSFVKHAHRQRLETIITTNI